MEEGSLNTGLGRRDGLRLVVVCCGWGKVRDEDFEGDEECDVPCVLVRGSDILVQEQMDYMLLG
jgi:hypothetical protein